MPVPRQIGPYKILRRLGHGGMAEVFLGVRFGASGFEKELAIKTLLPAYLGNARLERLLIEEAKVGARFNHRNIVSVHDLNVDRGSYYVAMDYVHGADLRALLKRVLPAPALALMIAEEVALALGYVHNMTDEHGRALGLVHRDVSPSNILLSTAGEVKLADFGIAKATLLVDMTWGRFRKGKYAYMSPEQIQNQPLTLQSDQFGLGVALMEMLCGKRPFDGDSPVETMTLIREAKPPDLKGIPRKIRPIIRTCLARDPDDRFASAEHLHQAINKARHAFPDVSVIDLAEWVQSWRPFS